ncbi:hypothetical protein RW1_006_00640 [Rhodococcus wratislaviensis NBRC 100605]|uniref:Uncharacterized protein n=1 Tax=Rhodococcus wratislaviensis NBRC 100605 TaxID=1219028 RepID=X0QX41_RHOWR|nr:hypothetical protein RW1_006_00640 [Rhodococcus wratislaviensis NBRC 100605]
MVLCYEMFKVREDVRDGVGKSAFGAGPVVADDEDDQRVIGDVEFVEDRDEASDLIVGVRDEAGEHFLHPRTQVADMAAGVAATR